MDLKIPVHAYVPFHGQEKNWPAESQEHYNRILSLCQEVKIACQGGYAPWKMQVRNELMVDDCSMLLALWNGSTGGTANCIKYAGKVKRVWSNCWERYKVMA